MERNFWTEENKIINYDKLMRVDIKNKLNQMTNQCIYGNDLADYCYNYNTVIHSPVKAARFIADYAEEFVKSLNRYKQANGVIFPQVKDPTVAVNLMMLYKAKDIFNESEYIKSKADKKITLNTDTLSILYTELKVAELGDDVLQNKVFISREDLDQTSVDYLLANLDKIKGLSLSQIAESLPQADVSERTAKSLLKNSYSRVANILLNHNDVSVSGLREMLSDVITLNAIDVLKENLGLQKVEDVLTDKKADKLKDLAEIYETQVGVQFNPMELADEEIEIDEQREDYAEPEKESDSRDNGRLR